MMIVTEMVKKFWMASVIDCGNEYWNVYLFDLWFASLISTVSGIVLRLMSLSVMTSAIGYLTEITRHSPSVSSLQIT